MSVRPITEPITNVPRGSRQSNRLWQKADTSITRVQCWTPAGRPRHGTRHSIYRMSELHWWMNFWRTIWDRAGRTMPGANLSGRLLYISIDPILGNLTRRSRKQHTVDGALLHEIGNRSWLIVLPKGYSFIYPPPIPWPGELSPPADPKITRILFIFGTIG